jgi:hypothetical protein
MFVTGGPPVRDGGSMPDASFQLTLATNIAHHIVAALTRLAEAGEPVSRASEQLRTTSFGSRLRKAGCCSASPASGPSSGATAAPNQSQSRTGTSFTGSSQRRRTPSSSRYIRRPCR